MKKLIKKILPCLLAFIVLFSFPVTASAADPTDEIKNFIITVDVNEDATLHMTYHIDWLVLDSDDLGPLTWVDLGMPNGNYSDLTPLSATIKSIAPSGSNVKIYLDRSYYEGETASFEFSFTQGNLYQIDKYREGETVYSFTPAWFNEIHVDHLEIRWNKTSAGSWQPECEQDGDYLVWSAELEEGGKYKIEVVYPGDAFLFTEEGSVRYASDGNEDDLFYEIIGLLVVIAIIALAIGSIIRSVTRRFSDSGRGFGNRIETEKKITRTKIEYYDNCPNCGSAQKKEGADTCEYCGTSMVKSKEVVEETEIEHPEKYTTNGTYRYGSHHNTYIHVNVVNVPVSRSYSTGTHRSCVSSCASSCASHCACACACASSGRAGCSVKNFFDTEKHNRKYTVESKNQNGAE